MRSEINPQFAAIVPPSDVVVVITFEVELDTALGSMIICLPYATIEPIRSKLHASFQTERLEVDHAWVTRLKERLLETPVELKVHYGNTTITGNQLLRMQVGDVLVLDTDVEDLLTCTVAGVGQIPGYRGHGQSHEGLSDHQGKRTAVYIKRRFRPKERVFRNRHPRPVTSTGRSASST